MDGAVPLHHPEMRSCFRFLSVDLADGVEIDSPSGEMAVGLAGRAAASQDHQGRCRASWERRRHIGRRLRQMLEQGKGNTSPVLAAWAEINIRGWNFMVER